MKLRIVSVNDVYLLDNLPRLRTLVRHHTEHDPADALLVVVAGDFLSPSLLSGLDAGRGMIDCLDAMGVTHVTFGNHEDDLATDDLVARTHELRATWLATNVRGLDPALPASDVIDAGGVRVGLVGVVMNDPAVYPRPPFGGAAIGDPIETAVREGRRLVDEEGCSFVVPLTHQTMDADRALARAQPGRLFPVICGGHEHKPAVEEVNGSVIVKAGADATHAAILDLSADAHPGGAEVRVSVRLEEVAAYAEDPDLRERVERHLAAVRALEHATLLTLPEGQVLSSIGTRAAQTSMGTLVTSRVRDALGAEGCIVNGGGIRGAREHRGALTYGALEAEVPFDNEVVVARLPGRVLAEAVALSRRHAPRESGGFLQVDDGMRVDPDGHVLTHVGGAPLDPDRDYRIALVRDFFRGLDGVEPLVRFGTQHPERVPPADSGRGLRMLLVHSFAVGLWRKLGGFDAVDADGDGKITSGEVAARLARTTEIARPEIVADLVLRAVDTNQDHVITRDEADAVE